MCEIRVTAEPYAQTRKRVLRELCPARCRLERGGSLLNEVRDPEHAVFVIDKDGYGA